MEDVLQKMAEFCLSMGEILHRMGEFFLKTGEILLRMAEILLRVSEDHERDIQAERKIKQKGGHFMAGDYVPKNDQMLDAWMSNFITVLNAHLAEVGLVITDVEHLEADKAAFTTALGTHVAKQAEAISATTIKNTKREDVVDTLRPLVRRICGSPGMTDGLRAALGLTVPGTFHISSTPGDEVPDLFLESMPGKVVVHFGTDPSNERYNSKPSWARGCNIFRKKTGEDEYRLVVFAMSSPYVDNITGPASDYSYVAQYRGRKETQVGGESSPMSIASSGMIAA